MRFLVIGVGAVVSAAGIAAMAQERPPAPGEKIQIVKPVREMRSALAISYPEGLTLSVKFQGTERLPRSSGEAKVARKRGMTEIEIETDEMKPATLFGGDFATYVLWTVSPEGHVDNAGEIIVRGNRGKLNVSTPLQKFGMFITAEPHFLVKSPSTFVVMQNTTPKQNITGQMLDSGNIKYKGFDGQYVAARESLASVPESKGEIRSDVQQARLAIRLAERAGADKFAPELLNKAKDSWKKVSQAAEVGMDDRQIMTVAHETVRQAYDAQLQAEERSYQAALDAERQEHADEISRMEQSIAAASSEAERAKLLAEQKQMLLEHEAQARAEAQKAAASATEQALLAAQRAAEAEARAAAARAEANSMASAKQQAELEAQKAREAADAANREREETRERMRQALGLIVETRETYRGLVLNLPDILFDFNKSTLKPEAREKLSRVCGILLPAQGYDLKVEGHTDSIGSDEYNQKLSEKRAMSVQTYLSSCQLRAGNISSTGFGEANPVASNDTAEGRQKNRRVEIVIEDKENFGFGAATSMKQ